MECWNIWISFPLSLDFTNSTFFLGSKLFFSLNFSLFWQKVLEIGLFFLEKRKLIFFKIFNVFKPYFSKKLGEFDLFLSNFSKKPSPFTDFCLNSFFSLLLAVAYFSEICRTLITFQKFFSKIPQIQAHFSEKEEAQSIYSQRLFFQTFSRYSNDMTPISKPFGLFL